MAEKRDIHFGAPPEIVEFAKSATLKSGRTMATIVKAAYKKWGEEAIEVFGEAIKELAKQEGIKHREECGYKPEEVNVRIALSEIYPKSHNVFGIAGLDFERIKLEDDESDSRAHYCALLEAWKTVWDEPWHMCQIFATMNDDGYMEGVNPKLEWSEHTEKHGCPGLARNKDTPCIFKLRLNK